MDNNFQERFTEAKTTHNILLKEINKLQQQKKSTDKLYKDLVKARKIIIEVTKSTQKKFKTRVEGLVTMVLQSVFNSDLSFELKIVPRKNKTEIVPVLLKNGYEYDPGFESGGGIIDVISFALRVVLQTLESNKPRKTIILDEPFRCLGVGESTERVSKMLKTLTERLGIQIIMVTHNQGLTVNADKTFTVTYNQKLKSSIVKAD